MATSTLGSRKPSNISQAKNVALKLPKIALTKGYFGQFKGYIFTVLGHFLLLFCVLGFVGHRGFAIVLFAFVDFAERCWCVVRLRLMAMALWSGPSW